MQTVKTSKIRNNPNNPRIIKDDKFKKLVQSIKDFPEMLEKRPLICETSLDGSYMVLGGNMRLRACQEAGLKEIPIDLADNWTAEQKRQFVIKDNIGYGEWDFSALAAEYDIGELQEWGLDIPNMEYSDKNQEIDVNEFSDEMSLVLKYSQDNYNAVRQKLSEINASPEIAIMQLLEI